jgi:hypothetical protein
MITGVRGGNTSDGDIVSPANECVSVVIGHGTAHTC